MASRKLLRDSFLAGRPLLNSLLKPSQSVIYRNTFRLPGANGSSNLRQFSVFNEFSKNIKGEATSNPEFQQSVKELKQKAEELKGVKEDLKVRTKQTTEQLYKKVDGVWTEAESVAKKVSATVKEKLSAATEEVKESFKTKKPEHSESSSGSATNVNAEGTSHATSEGFKNRQEGFSDTAKDTLGNFWSAASLASSKLSSGYQALKEAKVVDFAKRGYDIVKDELTGKPYKRKHLQHDIPSPSKVEKSMRTDVVIVPTNQSPLSKKWEALKDKMRNHPIFKRVKEPLAKGQELVEDVRETWETSDHPLVHKVQDANDRIFGESNTAISFKEIRRRDPNFSLPDFVAEVQEVVKPVLTAYNKGDVETLKKYCSPELIERCMAEHKAFQSQGMFFENKILHISDVEVTETRMMGSSPLIIVGFQTHQIFCIRDKDGEIKEGGQDTIHNVHYRWGMLQVPPEELGEGAYFPIWRVRDMVQQNLKFII